MSNHESHIHSPEQKKIEAFEDVEKRIKDLEDWKTKATIWGQAFVAFTLLFLGLTALVEIPKMVTKDFNAIVTKDVQDKINEATAAADRVIALQNKENTFTATLGPQNVMARPLIGPLTFSCFISTHSAAPAVGSVTGLRDTSEIGSLFVSTMQNIQTKDWGVYVRVDFKGPPRSSSWEFDLSIVQPGAPGKSTTGCQPYAPSDTF